MAGVNLFNRYGIINGHSYNSEDFKLLGPRENLSRVGRKEGLRLPDYHDQSKVRKVIQELGNKKEISNILRGPRYPIKLDKIPDTDLGTVVQTAVGKVARLFVERYHNSFFNFTRSHELPYNMKIIPASGYKRLVEKLVHEPVIAVLFPLALYGLPVWKQIEIIKDFPDNMMLSGPLDLLQAVCVYPEFFLNGCHSYDTLAVKWGNSSMVLAVNHDRAIADYRYNLAATEYFSGVLVIE